MRVDDSVLRVIDDAPYFIRRARGYAPDPLLLEETLPQILGAGAELKNTFCLTRDNYAFVSHFIGDLENYETLSSYENAIAHYEKLFKIEPELFACDLHPDYLSTQYANERACRENKPLIQVQHHHAHLAACLAENGWTSDEPVIGLTFDGTGYGTGWRHLGWRGAGWQLCGLRTGLSTWNTCPCRVGMPPSAGRRASRWPTWPAAGLEWSPDLAPVACHIGRGTSRPGRSAEKSDQHRPDLQHGAPVRCGLCLDRYLPEPSVMKARRPSCSRQPSIRMKAEVYPLTSMEI